jgi:hypothetical protein
MTQARQEVCAASAKLCGGGRKPSGETYEEPEPMEGKQVVRVGGGEARASKGSRLALGVSILQVKVLQSAPPGLGWVNAGGCSDAACA